MIVDQIAALEKAAEPYLESGYKIFSQTDSSLTLIRERPRFSVIAFIVLLVIFWPAAIIYSAVNRSRRDKVACLRITSLSNIEETGDTLENPNNRISLPATISIVLLVVITTVLLLMLIKY